LDKTVQTIEKITDAAKGIGGLFKRKK
jgi:hypothetical protein